MKVNNNFPVTELLQACLAADHNWLVLKGDEMKLDLNSLKLFKSSIDAIRYCREHAVIVDPVTKMTHNSGLRYHSIQNLLVDHIQDMAIKAGKTLDLVAEVPGILAALKEKNVTLANTKNEMETCIDLSLGRFVSACHTETIIPLEKIDLYYIFPRLTIPNVSQGGLSLLNFIDTVLDDYALAFHRFENLASAQPTPPKGFESSLCLVGKYRDLTLQADGEGSPILQTGVMLKSRSMNGFGKLTEQNLDPTQPIARSILYYLRLEPSSGKLLCYDDKLLPVNITDLRQSVVDENFSQFVASGLRVEVVAEHGKRYGKQERRQKEDPGETNKLSL